MAEHEAARSDAANVGEPLAHARERFQLASSFESFREQLASSQGDQLAQFAETIAPLEVKAGQPLLGIGHDQCLEAFFESADGFRECAGAALVRGRNPLSLLVCKVRDGDHRRLAVTARARSAGSFERVERWVRTVGFQYEPHGFFEELARFPELDDLAQQKLGHLYDELRAGRATESSE
jgi:hypothetical protein